MADHGKCSFRTEIYSINWGANGTWGDSATTGKPLQTLSMSCEHVHYVFLGSGEESKVELYWEGCTLLRGSYSGEETEVIFSCENSSLQVRDRCKGFICLQADILHLSLSAKETVSDWNCFSHAQVQTLTAPSPCTCANFTVPYQSFCCWFSFSFCLCWPLYWFIYFLSC